MAIIQNRITNVLLVVALLALLTVIAMLARSAQGGPIDPPGPPASTLPQVEPRTPISTLPFTITQPGSYFLTRNLTGGAGFDGITVLADNVTIDLNGFTLSGVAGSASAISEGGSASPHSGWVVMNGVIANWSDGTGIFAPNAQGGRFEDLRITGAGHEAINAGAGSVVERVVADGDSNYAILLRSSSRVSDCLVRRTTAGGYNGIWMGANAIVTNCAVYSYSYGIVVAGHSRISGCDVIAAGGNAIQAISASDVRGCTAVAPAGAGIEVSDGSSAVDNKIDGSAVGIRILGAGGTHIERNTITSTTTWLSAISGTGSVAFANRLHAAGGTSVCGGCTVAIALYEYTKPDVFEGANPNSNIVY